MTITSNEADFLMDFATFIYLHNGGRPDIDEATKFAREMFKEFCTIEGITDVCTNKDWYCEFCELCEHWDECKDRNDDCDGNCDECDEQCFTEGPDDLEIGYNPYIGGYDYDC